MSARILSILLLLLPLLAATYQPAQAYLSVIRQGPESRGANEAGDKYGWSTAVGDFNGDGYDDLAVGSPYEDASGVTFAGYVVVSYGSEYGIKRSGAQGLLMSDGLSLQNSALFGLAVAAGDFDDDGYDDLAVGAPNADADASHTNTGYVFVYAGGPSGLSYWHYLWQPGAGGALESGDRFGASLAVGNFNHVSGGEESLAVGSPGEDSDAGAVFWYTGGSNGLLNGSYGWFKQSTLGGTNVAGDQFGYSLAAGNMAASYYEELAIGAPFKEVSGTDDAGVVWKVRGSSTGLVTSGARMIRPDEEDLTNSPYPDGYFGWSLAAGRFYGGSFDGLAIGEPGRSYFGHASSGRVVVGKGGTAGLSFSDGDQRVFFQDDMGWALGSNDGFGKALAAGYYDTADGGEDLIIGSPTDNSNGGPFMSGVISVCFGGPSGPGPHGWTGWAQDAFSDDITQFDEFGRALAVGQFDGTNRGNLAVGAPGEDSGAGQVTIVAPWRQHPYAGSFAGISLDCEGSWIYAHKPYDELQVASTTKIMTVLIACERMALPTNDPKYVSPNATYTVPEWIRDNIGGSLYDFEPQQRVDLWDLLYCCIFPSGNDAAYAIADLLNVGVDIWGGAYDNTCQTFVAEMNQRAADLGMTRTHFTNPAGLDKGTPYSCAADLAILGRAAMANVTFRTVAGSTGYTFDTSAVYGGVRTNYSDTITYGWLQRIQNYNASFAGLKPGETPKAKKTGVYGVRHDGETAIVVTLGNVDRTQTYETADALMDLGRAECTWDLAARGDGSLAAAMAMPAAAELDAFRVDFGELPTQVGAHSGGASELQPPTSAVAGFTQLDLLRPVGSGLTSCQLKLSRSAELELGPFAEANLGIGPFQSHNGLVLINHGEASATVLLNTSHTGTPIVVSLDPGERYSIPPFNGAEVANFSYSIENVNQTETVSLGLREEWTWNKSGIPVGPNPFWSAALQHSDAIGEQAFRVHVTGSDPQPGRMVHVSLHDPGVTVDAPDAPTETTDLTALRVEAARPNPFSTATHLAYTLPTPGDLRLEIFDLSGRRVQSFERKASPAGPGFFDWDGADAHGRAAAPGVYFFRMTRDGADAVSGRVTLIR